MIWYDKDNSQLVISLANGATLSIPTSQIERLSEAEDSQIRDYYLTSYGMTIHFPILDVEYSIRGLV